MDILKVLEYFELAFIVSYPIIMIIYLIAKER